MRYPLHDMNCDDFENLVILICIHILGSATIPFAKGKDGGKDGKFVGRANRIPSEAKPWEGKIIIQAKHTIKVNASCSDGEFDKILRCEVIPAVKKMKDAADIDFYLLFTNRKLTGIKDGVIEKQIIDNAEVTSILIGEERIQMYLREYPDVVKDTGLNRLLLPFDFDESDLRDVISTLHEEFKEGNSIPDGAKFEYPGLDRKNELNQLGKEYFDNVMKASMDDFSKIRNFLMDPINQDWAALYDDAVSELNAKIMWKRSQFYEFEQVIETCYDNMVKNGADALKGKKKLLRILLHYMYCNCDIGIKE